MNPVRRAEGPARAASPLRTVAPCVGGVLAAVMVLLVTTLPPALALSPGPRPSDRDTTAGPALTPGISGGTGTGGRWSAANATGNLTAALGRAVLLVGLAAGALVTLVWSRVAVSWFSHDPSRKVQAKERARDAAIGSLVLVAAISGLAWGLARFVLTGT